MTILSQSCRRLALLFGMLALPLPLAAWELAGTKTIALADQHGKELPIGTVSFRPQGERIGFVLKLDDTRFKDFFLSMKEFKCLEGPEVMCHVPYPHATPASVTPDDLAWLEHALLFLHKSPGEFSAKLWNGLYYRMTLTPDGIVGVAQAVDLNLIGAPPELPGVPPYRDVERSDVAPGSRWLGRLTIR